MVNQLLREFTKDVEANTRALENNEKSVGVGGTQLGDKIADKILKEIKRYRI